MTREEVNYVLGLITTNGILDKSKILLIEFDNNGTLTADRDNPNSFEFIEPAGSTEGGMVKIRYMQSGFKATRRLGNGRLERVQVDTPTVAYRTYDMIQAIHIADPEGTLSSYSGNKLILQERE